MKTYFSFFPPVTKPVFAQLLKAQTHSSGEVIILWPTTSPAICHQFVHRSCNALSSACLLACLDSPSHAPEQRGLPQLGSAGLVWGQPSKSHFQVGAQVHENQMDLEATEPNLPSQVPWCGWLSCLETAAAFPKPAAWNRLKKGWERGAAEIGRQKR